MTLYTQQGRQAATFSDLEQSCQYIFPVTMENQDNTQSSIDKTEQYCKSKC